MLRGELSESKKTHQVARRRILSGEKRLSYREVQKLVKLNGLSKATGPRQLLENSLLEYFRRLEPKKVQRMTRWESFNIRYNLDGEKEGAHSEEEMSEYGAAEDKKYEKIIGRRQLNKERRLFQKRALESLVADIENEMAVRQARFRKKEKGRQYEEVTGAYYASPAVTGRARCQKCSEKIGKGTIRVTHHELNKFTNRSGGWTVRKSEKHFHASCFIAERSEVPVNNCDKELSMEIVSEEFLTTLRDEIIRMNDIYRRDKDYQRMLSGPVALSYPLNVITFGREDPDVVATIIRRPGVIGATAKAPSDSKP